MSSSRQIIKKLNKAGWRKVRIKGDHHIFSKEGEPNLVVVTHPRKDLPIGLERDILKKAGLL